MSHGRIQDFAKAVAIRTAAVHIGPKQCCNAYLHSGCAYKQCGNAYSHSGCAYKQCGNAYSHSGSAHKQCGNAYLHSGSAHKQCGNGLFAEHSQNFNLFQK